MRYPATGLILALASTASAQDSGGLDASVSVSQTLRYANSDGFSSNRGSFFGQTNLGFDLSSQTRTQSFSVRANTGFTLDDEADVDIIEPTVALSYRTFSKRSDFFANLTFRTTELDSFLSDDETTGIVTVLDGVTLTNLAGNVGLVFGKDMPIGGSLTLSSSSRDFSDNSDPDLVDVTSTTLNGRVNLKIDDRITGRVVGSWSDLEESDDTSRQSISGGVGADFLVNKNLTASIDIGYQTIETTNAAGTSTSDGLSYSLGATQQFPSGSISGRVNGGISQNGSLNSFSISGDRELKNGQISGSIGGNLSDESDFEPLYNLSYSTELIKGGQLTASFGQSFDIDTDGTERINTRANLNFSTALTRVSSFSTGLGYRDTRALNLAGEDANRFDFNVQYRRTLTRDWGLVSGFTYSFATEDGEEDRSSNGVFVGVNRSFDWRP